MSFGPPVVEHGPFKFERTKENFDLMRLELLFDEEVSSDKWIKKNVEEIFYKSMGTSNHYFDPCGLETILTSFQFNLMEWLNKNDCPITELKWMFIKMVNISGNAGSIGIMYKSVFNFHEYHQISIEIY